jgi:ABC-type transport system involved in cytochrome c biogenesis permease subunit
MKQVFLFISLIIVGAGIYLKFFYDVPDSQTGINFFVSWFFVIVGVSSLLINIFWQTPKPPRNLE